MYGGHQADEAPEMRRYLPRTERTDGIVDIRRKTPLNQTAPPLVKGGELREQKKILNVRSGQKFGQ
jgi:hypothetical protein